MTSSPSPLTTPAPPWTILTIQCIRHCLLLPWVHMSRHRILHVTR